MSDAVRDAKLKLTLDSADAVRGMSALTREGERVEQQQSKIASAAEKAAKAIERYGATELSKPEARKQRNEERAAQRREETEVKRQIRDEAAAREMSRKAMEDARRKRTEAEEADRQRAEREEAQAAKKSEVEQERKKKRRQEEKRKERQFVAAFENEQEVMEIAARKEAAAKHQQSQANAYREKLRTRMHNLGMIDARSDEEKIRDEERRQGSLAGRLSGALDATGLGGLARMAAPVAAASTLVNATTTTFNAARNSDMTAAQGVEKMLDGIPVVGAVISHVRGLANALDGTTERVRKATLRLTEDPQRLAVQTGHRRAITEADLAAQNARHQAQVFASLVAAPVQQFDRRTLSGEIGYHEEQQRIPARDAAMIAQAEAEIARRQAQTAAGMYSAADTEYEQQRLGRGRSAVNNYNKTRGRETGYFRNRANVAEASATLINETDREEALYQRRVEMLRRSEQAAVGAANAEARARQANIAVMQTELQITQQREQRLVADASRLGGTNFIDRQLGLQAARMVRDQGIGNVTQEVLARARSFAPDWVQQQQMRFGETTPEMQAGRREGFLTPGTQTIDQLRGQAAQQQQEVRDLTIDSQRQLTSEVADIIGRTLEAIKDDLEDKMRRLENRLLAGRQLANNS